MKCPNPDCKNEISPGSKFCSECGTPIPQAPENKGDAGGVQTGDIGYVEGNITDASQHGRSYVGSVVVQTGEHKAPSIVTCPICGRRNELMNTFECMQCHKDYLCLRHQDEDSNLCQVCTREHKARLRIEKLERDAREAEAADDLEGAIALLDQLLPLTENRQAILDWKARLEHELDERCKEELEKPLSIIENFLGIKFVLIPPGNFMMGSPPDEAERKDDEDQHQVTLTNSFYMQTTPITVGQRRDFVNATEYKTEVKTGGGAWVGTRYSFKQKKGAFWGNPGFSQNDNHPVTCVSWNDAQNLIQWLNRKEGGRRYRLPTESEWEYAARAGSTTAFANGDITDTAGCAQDPNLSAMGWYCGNSEDRTHRVAAKKANNWGLYDMHGNVSEWCLDRYGDYPSGPVTDPKGPAWGQLAVHRGGSWNCHSWMCRSADRHGCRPDLGQSYIGFRLARDP